MLHALNTVLVFLVFCRLTGATGRSFVVAALFGLHPLRVESVAWVAERKDVLSTFFCLLTLWAYAAYSQARAKIKTPTPGEGRPARDSRRAAAAYGLSLVFFALGLMSKPMLVTLPFVLLLLDYWPLARFEPSPLDSGAPFGPRRLLSALGPLLVEKVPFFLLTAASTVITFLIQNRGGAVVGRLALDIRLRNALVAYCRYLGKLIWPSNLSIFYPYPDHPWPLYLVLPAAALIGAVSLLALACARRRPFFPVGWFWFVGTLVPVIGIIQVGGQSMADRYTYIPSIGIFVLLVWGVHDLMRLWQFRVPAAATLATGALLGCVLITRQDLAFWQNGETLFRRALAVNGPNALALSALGQELIAGKNWDEGIPLSQQSIRLAPNYSDAWQALGSARIAQGRLDDAIAIFQSEIKATPSDAQAHRDLGAAFCQTHRWPEAAAEFEEAIRLRPAYAAAHRGLGLALVREQRPAEAMNEYLAAMRLHPEAHDHSAVAEILIQQGRPGEALNQFRQAMAMEPTNAAAHLAAGQLLSGQSNASRRFQRISNRPPPRLESGAGSLPDRRCFGRAGEAGRSHRPVSRRPRHPA